MSDNNLKRVVIEPVTRVEGHGKVTVLLDENNKVKQARLHIVEFRGFERFIQGRPFWEVPVLVQRLCGICPVSHHLAAAKAMDIIVGGENITPTAEKMRRLMHYGQTFQSFEIGFSQEEQTAFIRFPQCGQNSNLCVTSFSQLGQGSVVSGWVFT